MSHADQTVTLFLKESLESQKRGSNSPVTFPALPGGEPDIKNPWPKAAHTDPHTLLGTWTSQSLKLGVPESPLMEVEERL